MSNVAVNHSHLTHTRCISHSVTLQITGHTER